MNVDSPAIAGSGSSSSHRKDRGSIAAQACDTCRSRKHKCDEKRPKCSSCIRLGQGCFYRETQPTKKDKTLVEILDYVKANDDRMKANEDRMKVVELNIERIHAQIVPINAFGPLQVAPSSQPTSPYPPRNSQWESSNGRSQPYRHASAAHKMLTWPAIRNMLVQAAPHNIRDFSIPEGEGTLFIARLQQRIPKFPLDEILPDQPFVGMQMQATRASGGPRVTFPGLSTSTMHILATSYFDTFNLIYPFMDRTIFLDKLAKVNSEGFNGDNDSVIALLVFALGELALQATRGEPIAEYKGRASGLRGGTAERPPGLALFNEARKRIGFALAEYDLENVQIFSLAALYYASCSRHMEFWRLTVLASLACQVFITCQEIDWGTPQGDLIKRAYWHCVIMERGLHLELDFPFTSIMSLEESIDLPSFNSPSNPFCEADHHCNKSSHFAIHYTSHLSLLRLCATLHNDINDSTSTTDTPAASSEELGGPTASTLRQIASQLDQWRSLLPPELQWPEKDPTVFPRLTNIPRPYDDSIDPSLAPASRDQPEELLFTPNLDHEAELYPYAYDIQVALLRTRYYHAKYMVYRPFVQKALHFPDQMTSGDKQGVAACLKSCLKWPLAFAPPSRHKRLIPFLFGWSQNFLSILLVLYMSRQVPALRQVREQLGDDFEDDVQTSTDLMIDWIRDLRDCDPIAAWCYNVLEVVYDMESLGDDRADREM